MEGFAQEKPQSKERIDEEALRAELEALEQYVALNTISPDADVREAKERVREIKDLLGIDYRE